MLDTNNLQLDPESEARESFEEVMDYLTQLAEDCTPLDFEEV